jgi:hypothetical protein
MSFISAFKAFFKAPNDDTNGISSHDAFTAASDCYHAASNAVSPYTTRANAAYTDPTDFEPYTAAYLDAHTAALDTQSAAFDALIAAFNMIEQSNKLYHVAAAVYKASCDIHIFASEAYSKAAHCAMTIALKGKLQNAKDEYELFLLDCKAADTTEPDASTTKAKAAAFKVIMAEDNDKALQLEQKASIAESKAKEFLSKGEIAMAIAEKAWETSK